MKRVLLKDVKKGDILGLFFPNDLLREDVIGTCIFEKLVSVYVEELKDTITLEVYWDNSELIIQQPRKEDPQQVVTLTQEDVDLINLKK